jgi:prepilin-type N-terminal cleavage/methylation domain-containing protein
MTTQRKSRAFTMVELMTVLTIIVILVTILLPVVSSARKRAAAALVNAQLSGIAGAMDRYHQEFGAYPGPLPDNWLGPNPSAAANITIGPGGPTVINAGAGKFITETENAVLGLCGGLAPPPAGSPLGAPCYFDQALVGNGPRNLNPSKPKRYDPFLDVASGNQKLLTDRPDKQAADYAGDYRDNAGEAQDSAIPELVDRFSSPMPILILRAKVGAGGVVSIGGRNGTLPNGATEVIGLDNNGNPISTQYDLRQIAPYVMTYNGQTIGEGKSIRAKDYLVLGVQSPPPGSTFPHGLQSVNDVATLNAKTSTYPFDAFPYFNNASIPPSPSTAFAGGAPGSNLNSAGTPKQKDKYIIISAGIDRVYGTADDIAQFGSIMD